MKRWLLLLLLPGLVFAQDDMWDDEEWGDEDEASAWSGFVEGAIGTRFDKDPLVANRNTLEDLRLRLENEWQAGKATIRFKADLGYDGIENDAIADFRDLGVSFAMGEKTDATVGRQVQTWGTGDLVFLNDLFPKDYQSFFSGREDEYLKAPGDALRLTRYSDVIGVDFVWTPVFEPNIYITGERYSFYSPIAGGNVAPIPPFRGVRPDKRFENGEFALRLFKTVNGREFAFYGYRGFSKNPSGVNAQLQPTFEKLNGVGGSLRQSLGAGLFNTEVSYYDLDDELRALVGYEWEAKPRFTIGLQYYVEKRDAVDTRHLLTNRLTYRAGMDKHTWSLFTFWSPSDQDFYMRPAYTYRHSDEWSLTAGGNLFGGKDDFTFFNQFRDASNVYLRVRYNY